VAHPDKSKPPPLYAMTLPGLESVAEEEISELLGAEIKRTAPGLVVFRPARLDLSVLSLRTVEDVFLLAWGTDKLTYRAVDLESIRKWTAREPDWAALLRIHHGIRPKPKGKPTYRLVTQMTGEHGYRRGDAGKALARGLEGKLPVSWRHAQNNAAVEIWLTIHGATAVCGMRLSDRTLRHRTYKQVHLPASLRPTLAATMVRLAEAKPKQLVLDPMCGAGTLLAEQLALGLHIDGAKVKILGGDIDPAALRTGAANLRSLGRALLARWDARRLPLPRQCVDRVVSNPPFGIQMGDPAEIAELYQRITVEYDRVLRRGGRAVLLVADIASLNDAVRRLPWKSLRQLRVRVLGQRAFIGVWRKD
jgi:tRNA (guanine6-N2)-methyltransferase